MDPTEFLADLEDFFVEPEDTKDTNEGRMEQSLQLPAFPALSLSEAALQQIISFSPLNLPLSPLALHISEQTKHSLASNLDSTDENSTPFSQDHDMFFADVSFADWQHSHSPIARDGRRQLLPGTADHSNLVQLKAKDFNRIVRELVLPEWEVTILKVERRRLKSAAASHRLRVKKARQRSNASAAKSVGAVVAVGAGLKRTSSSSSNGGGSMFGRALAP